MTLELVARYTRQSRDARETASPRSSSDSLSDSARLSILFSDTVADAGIQQLATPSRSRIRSSTWVLKHGSRCTQKGSYTTSSATFGLYRPFTLSELGLMIFPATAQRAQGRLILLLVREIHRDQSRSTLAHSLLNKTCSRHLMSMTFYTPLSILSRLAWLCDGGCDGSA